ncbi:hypothetical protein [Streptomyces sp. NPDC048248]|uniref:hypothetical protein n=1 Tax=Streptomyces sp. NPDC048248 TaxID=3365523 RepID=UPI0037145719
MTDYLGGVSGTAGNTLGGVVDTVGSLINDIIKAGPGGTITQDMVDQANKVKPAVDKANG